MRSCLVKTRSIFPLFVHFLKIRCSFTLLFFIPPKSFGRENKLPYQKNFKKLKNNFKIKTLYFLIFFLSLFKFESVNSEEIKDQPYIRGEYLVCANSKVLPYSFWRDKISTYGWSMNDLQPKFQNAVALDLDISDLFRWAKRDWWVTSEVIIGKEPKRYSKDETEVIVTKLLKRADIPTSYKSTSIEFTGWDKYKGNGSSYHFKNSENKIIAIKYYDRGVYLFDNNGNPLELNKGIAQIRIYCTNDDIVLRAVQQLIIIRGQTKNEFGEEIKLPTVFWIREIGVKTEPPPTMEKKFEF